MIGQAARTTPDVPFLEHEQDSSASLYLDLLKRCLTRLIFYTETSVSRSASRTTSIPRKLLRAGTGYFFFVLPALISRGLPVDRSVMHRAFGPLQQALLRRHERTSFDVEARIEGHDWPAEAETMIGMHRLNNLQACIVEVLRLGVPGDLIETGVWRGGAVILMRAVLKAYNDSRRTVWVADSFEGLPKPDREQYPADKDLDFWSFANLAVSVDDVKANFRRYGLLDDQVRFLVGWFRDTLPSAPIEAISVLRLDGDMYESTMDALKALYPKLSVGGFVIVDDYLKIDACRTAVDDYRAEHGISDPIVHIDQDGVFWQRQA